MTLRTTFHATLVAGALFTGIAALPQAAAAAPARVADTESANDGLAPLAGQALIDWQAYVTTGDRTAFAEYYRIRNGIAAEVATRLSLDPTQMQVAWRDADPAHQVALLSAVSQLGTPYRGFKAIPGIGFDCSGLTSWAWAQAGVALDHQSRKQIQAARTVTMATAQAGDLVYYPGHVMIYLGLPNAIVHAPNSGRRVEVGFVGSHRINSARYGDPFA